MHAVMKTGISVDVIFPLTSRAFFIAVCMVFFCFFCYGLHFGEVHVIGN